MGKNFQSGGAKSGAANRNAPSKVIRRNISKKESDKKRRVSDYNKSLKRSVKIEQKKNDWEMRRQAKRQVAAFKRPKGFEKGKKGEEAEWEDVDEHEKDVFDKDGYYDVMETEAMISKNDQQILEQFRIDANKPVKVSEGKSLADLIMQKLSAGDF